MKQIVLFAMFLLSTNIYARDLQCGVDPCIHGQLELLRKNVWCGPNANFLAHVKCFHVWDSAGTISADVTCDHYYPISQEDRAIMEQNMRDEQIRQQNENPPCPVGPEAKAQETETTS